MKLIKTASGKYKITKQAWEEIGKKAGWKKAQISSFTGMGENEYRTSVKLNCTEYGPNGEWEAVIDSRPIFKYNIELEYRSWGIKDINVSFNEILNETIIITHFDKEGNEIKTEDKPISIDLSQIPIDYVEGNGIFVTEIDLQLAKDLTVDYKASSITVVKGVSG